MYNKKKLISKKNNIDDSIKEKVNENKENVTEQSKNLFDKK